MRTFQNKITAGDIIIIGIIFVVSLGLIAHSFYRPSGGTAEIYVDNKLIDKVKLTADKVYEYQGVISPVVVRVSEAKIEVVESGCPLHLCVKRGKISRVGESVVCLPNRFIVVISEGEKASVEGVTG